jgi:phosphoenolpyruvate carboxylase
MWLLNGKLSIYSKGGATQFQKIWCKSILFDGRGGPPARGGKTHKFCSLGPKIENNEIQITVQGQTISSNFEL